MTFSIIREIFFFEYNDIFIFWNIKIQIGDYLDFSFLYKETSSIAYQSCSSNSYVKFLDEKPILFVFIVTLEIEKLSFVTDSVIAK
jgi:hypothetical protein